MADQGWKVGNIGSCDAANILTLSLFLALIYLSLDPCSLVPAQ